MPYFLGIDGGGSKTVCALGDERRLLAQAAAAASNVASVGEEAARASLQSAIHAACQAANVSPDEINGMCVGIAGASRPGVVQLVRHAVGGRCPLEVVGDVAIALEAGVRGGPGFVVISGTGSVSMGRNEQGAVARAGGWGPLISDEGSGNWIGRAAVSAAMRARDRGEESALLAAVLQFWRLQQPEEVTAAAESRNDFSKLVAPVVELAERGDAGAAGILSAAGGELAALATIVVGKLWPRSQPVSGFIAGGVLQNCRLVRESFMRNLAAHLPQVKLRAEPVDPVAGALFLARQAWQRAGHEG